MVMFPQRFEFGSKAETLEAIAPIVTRSVVPDFFSFAAHGWGPEDHRELLASIRERFTGRKIIVRSSAAAEDAAESALAGAFTSVANVDPDNAEEVHRAVTEVVDSYAAHGAAHATDNHVIVQAMVTDVLMSGVLFTQDLNTGAPYYVINYDDESGATDTVTAGTGYTNRTLYVFRDAWGQVSSERFRTLLEAVREVEDLTGSTTLDIEFALDHDLIVHLLQVRRITTHANWNRGQILVIADALRRLEEGLTDRYGADWGPAGVVLGNMPDWNPAEMIGTTPRPLAFSLYRLLITDRVWRVARRQMGYREHRGVPLMMSLAGQPYIDVRESFNSYLPASLPEQIGERLARAWLQRLGTNHHLHDKVEFDVAVTAFTPDFSSRVREQFPDVLTDDEEATFKASLKTLTNDLLAGRRAPIQAQLQMIEQLEECRRAAIEAYDVPRFETVLRLLEDATGLGTLPFSVLARHAFIATSILKGLVRRGVLSAEQASGFQRSVTTVATEFIRDVDLVTEGALSEEELLDRYGHLRPGTYDILSLRYDQRPGSVSTTGAWAAEAEGPIAFQLDAGTMRDMTKLLASEGFETDASELIEYMAAAVRAREQAKFVFTHSVSDALEVIAAIGERHGLSRDDISFIDVRWFLDAFIEPSGRSIERELREYSTTGRERHQVASAVRLPSLVTRLSDLWIVPLRVEQPNYVTRKKTEGDVFEVSGALLDPTSIDDKVVAIQSADPGFDWIFTRPFRGLVTRFGGANSHMAIRCAEFGIPAAIGCGEQIYDRVLKAGRIELNCADGRIVMASTGHA